jgi:hypothetical protein
LERGEDDDYPDVIYQVMKARSRLLVIKVMLWHVGLRYWGLTPESSSDSSVISDLMLCLHMALYLSSELLSFSTMEHQKCMLLSWETPGNVTGSVQLGPQVLTPIFNNVTGGAKELWTRTFTKGKLLGIAIQL